MAQGKKAEESVNQVFRSFDEYLERHGSPLSRRHEGVPSSPGSSQGSQLADRFLTELRTGLSKGASSASSKKS